MRQTVSCGVLCAFLFYGPGSFGASGDQLDSVRLFVQAREQTMLRQPGTQPFHLRVTFHALPGVELVPPGKDQILTGDGTCEEIWFDPHRWRREVTLGQFHAVEEQAPDGRRFQSSDEYVPVRILMLLDALLDPIPKSLVSLDLGGKASRSWKVDRVSSSGGEFVRLHKEADGLKSSLTEAFFLLPSGDFVLHNDRGLVMSWEKPVHFSGKQVPTHVRVLAEPDRELVTADITVTSTEAERADALTLSGPVALPGNGLRPLHGFEVRMPNLSDSFMGQVRTSSDPMFGIYFPYSFHSVLDKQGRYRDVEVIHQPSWEDLMSAARAATLTEKQRSAVTDMEREFLKHRRGLRNQPATIDGSACQVLLQTGVFM